VITPDSQAILLLCSHLGLPSDAKFSPFKLREWNQLARQIHSNQIRPEDLMEWTHDDLRQNLGDEIEVDRISWLIGRSGPLALELERLETRGIKVLTRADMDYPQKYRKRLKDGAPPVLFYAGDKALIGQPGIAVVGSRQLDHIGQEFASIVGNACGYFGQILYSGGAKGVDSIAMQASLDVRGAGVGVLAHSLEREIRRPDNRKAIERGDLCLVTPYSPNAGFSPGAAMGRNRLIYTLADYAIVVASAHGKGGTWSGATQALKAEWLPIFVLEYEDMPEGNLQLLKKGALRLPFTTLRDPSTLVDWLKAKADQIPQIPIQGTLF